MSEFDNALIISDLHLTPAYPYTADRFIDFCKNEAREVQALFIIGDLFEFWVGDDAHLHTQFHHDIAEEIHAVSAAGVAVYFIAGNRDFLLGKAFQKLAGWLPLADPSIIKIGGKSWLLSHGDMLCTADTTYQLFRKWTRRKWIQSLFLLIPIRFRQMLGERLRKRARIKYELREYYDLTNAKIKEDVTLEACAKITQEYGCTQLIHGHTHLPGHHVESFAGQSWQRWVLSDWDLDHPEMKPRAKALMINQETIESIDLLKTSISR